MNILCLEAGGNGLMMSMTHRANNHGDMMVLNSVAGM